MKLLLDTHTALWFYGDADKLSEPAFNAIIEPENDKYVSVASAWELAVKISLGKLNFEGGTAKFLTAADGNGFIILPIKTRYLAFLDTLPFHHRDPFDRLLVTTAMSEKMSLITADADICKYDVPVIW